jgi:hypothetical protein
MHRLLFAIFYDFIIHYLKLDACLLKHLNSVRVRVIPLFTDDPFDASVDNHHGACSARRHLAKERGAFKRNSEPGSLKNCVLLSMQSTHAVLAYFSVTVGYLANVMSHFIAMR